MGVKIIIMPEISITTTQNVNINFTVAGPGQRLGAYLADLAIKVGYYLIAYNTVIAPMGIGVLGLDDWSMIAIMIMIMSPVIFYSLLFEYFMDGQTPGKKLLKIKVAKIDGYQASFMDYLTRWVLRLVDISGTMYLVGFISILVSRVHQRVGDMAAGTAVISLKNDISISHTILTNLAVDYQPVYPQVVRFSDNDMRIIKETFQMVNQNPNTEVLGKLVKKIEEVSGIKCESKPAAFITTIIKDYNYYTGQ